MISFFNVVHFASSIDEGTNAVLLPIGCEEHDPSVGPWNFQFDPALLLVELLVGEYLKTLFVSVERYCPTLVRDGDPEEFDALDQAAKNVIFIS